MRFINLSLLDLEAGPIKQWLAAAKQHHDRLKQCTTCQERKRYIEGNPHWSNIKSTLIEIYGNKCWYSESSLSGADGEIDHFRPQNRSQGISGKLIYKNGYWWLAYDIKNLRLSCQHCNQTRKKLGGGKSDKFPIRVVLRGEPTDDLTKEDYVLLDPTVKEDVALLHFNQIGRVVPLSSDVSQQERVIVTKKLLNLDAKEFVDERKDVLLACDALLQELDLVFSGTIEPNSQFINFKLKQVMRLTDYFRTPYSSLASMYFLEKSKDKEYFLLIQKWIYHSYFRWCELKKVPL